MLTGTNIGTTGSNVGSFNLTNTVADGVTVLSIRNAGALGNGTANSSLAPISMNATGTTLSASILEIGATIGTDPGGNNADFSYQLVNSNVTPGPGQIEFGALGNSDDGVGFAAYSGNATPRIIALYGTGGNSTTLATLIFKTNFGTGSGDHVTMGSATSNTTAILLNPINLQGGPSRRFASIRGVGNVPEGEFEGAISNGAAPAVNMVFDFDGNGGLIFANANSSFLVNATVAPGQATNTPNTGSFQIDNGAVFVAAFDPATLGHSGALGNGTAVMQVGTSSATNPATGSLNTIYTVATANLAFMTYGNGNGSLNQGVTASPGVITDRNIVVGGTGVSYANATLGTATDDYSAMNGNITLNSNLNAAPAPTTFTAANGGRTDFGGIISGGGSVVVGNSIVEGDATAAGIALNNNGTIVFGGADTYQGSTTINNGGLIVTGSIGNTTSVTVGNGVASAYFSSRTETLIGPVTVHGNASIDFSKDGVTGSAQTLTVPSLTLTTGSSTINSSSLTFNLTGANTSDTIAVTGNLALGASGNATVNFDGSAVTGNYTLLSFANQVGQSGSGFVIGAEPVGLFTASLMDTSTALVLQVSGNPTPPSALLVWRLFRQHGCTVGSKQRQQHFSGYQLVSQSQRNRRRQPDSRKHHRRRLHRLKRQRQRKHRAGHQLHHQQPDSQRQPDLGDHRRQRQSHHQRRRQRRRRRPRLLARHGHLDPSQQRRTAHHQHHRRADRRGQPVVDQ